MRKSCWHVLTSVQFIWSSYITCLHELVTVLISAYFPRYFCYFNEFNRIYYFAAILLFQWIPYFHIYYNSYFNESYISTYITFPISIRPICIIHRTIALSTDLIFSYFRHYFLSYFEEIHISQIWQCMPK